MPTQTERENRTYHGGQMIEHKRGKWWIYCYPHGFASLSAAKRWIDRNICPGCFKAQADCECLADNAGAFES
jgi:hypothetical protein